MNINNIGSNSFRLPDDSSGHSSTSNLLGSLNQKASFTKDNIANLLHHPGSFFLSLTEIPSQVDDTIKPGKEHVYKEGKLDEVGINGDPIDDTIDDLWNDVFAANEESETNNEIASQDQDNVQEKEISHDHISELVEQDTANNAQNLAQIRNDVSELKDDMVNYTSRHGIEIDEHHLNQAIEKHFMSLDGVEGDIIKSCGFGDKMSVTSMKF
ncbi:hypothetical protein PNK_p0122 (plasmid) [Candidatus Protochlamydia naegleriophila]|uniref:Uncharacterized protein n=1 Tax=Candidatus Protochlamydia naegleriophila TaxID=389348 RepID=A0A0U5JF95_9BACT|nr:hypothetical protein [Candidatus Protochlamydia naegleriophila]CUI18174.1 hypothetical protein PNK_p0122 [Candidatus Protochlamydia naegleriophila]